MIKLPTISTYNAATGCGKNPQGRNGVPDTIGLRRTDGLFVGVEVKTSRDTLHDDQREFPNKLKQAQGLAFIT